MWSESSFARLLIALALYLSIGRAVAARDDFVAVRSGCGRRGEADVGAVSGNVNENGRRRLVSVAALAMAAVASTTGAAPEFRRGAPVQNLAREVAGSKALALRAARLKEKAKTYAARGMKRTDGLLELPQRKQLQVLKHAQTGFTSLDIRLNGSVETLERQRKILEQLLGDVRRSFIQLKNEHTDSLNALNVVNKDLAQCNETYRELREQLVKANQELENKRTIDKTQERLRAEDYRRKWMPFNREMDWLIRKLRGFYGVLERQVYDKRLDVSRAKTRLGISLKRQKVFQANSLRLSDAMHATQTKEKQVRQIADNIKQLRSQIGDVHNAVRSLQEQIQKALQENLQTAHLLGVDSKLLKHIRMRLRLIASLSGNTEKHSKIYIDDEMEQTIGKDKPRISHTESYC